MLEVLKKAFGKKRQYRCYVFLADSASPPLWKDETWQALATALQPAVDACDGTAHVKVDAFEGDYRSERAKLGRLAWTNESFRTWTEAGLTVYLVSMLTPSYAVAEKRGRSPDLALFMMNQRALELDGDPVSHRLFLAVAEDVIDAELLQKVLREVHDVVKPQVVFHKVRPWGYLLGSSDKDTMSIADYQVMMPMYNERIGEPIGEPQHGWERWHPTTT